MRYLTKRLYFYRINNHIFNLNYQLPKNRKNERKESNYKVC